VAVLIFDDVGSSLMNHQEAKPFLPTRSRSVLPVPPNKAMQTDGRCATAADRQGVGRYHEAYVSRDMYEQVAPHSDA